MSLAVSPLVGSFFKEQFNIFIALGMAAFFRLIGSLSFFRRSKVEDGEKASNY
jgi:hypothetical protein